MQKMSFVNMSNNH